MGNLRIIKNAQTSEVLGDGKSRGLELQRPRKWRRKTVKLDGIFVQIGLVPNTEF